MFNSSDESILITFKTAYVCSAIVEILSWISNRGIPHIKPPWLHIGKLCIVCAKMHILAQYCSAVGDLQDSCKDFVAPARLYPMPVFGPFSCGSRLSGEFSTWRAIWVLIGVHHFRECPTLPRQQPVCPNPSHHLQFLPPIFAPRWTMVTLLLQRSKV